MGSTASSTGYYTTEVCPYVGILVDRYLGDVSSLGKPHGNGVLLYESGNAYVGGFKNGLRHGRGIHIDDERGDLYIGDWRDDSCHGNGCLSHRDGTFYTGSWVDGKPHGRGNKGKANGLLLETQYQYGLLVTHRILQAGNDGSSSSEADEQSDDDLWDPPRPSIDSDSNPESWSSSKVLYWLETVGLGAHKHNFQSVDGPTLISLSHPYLRDNLHIIPFGQRTRILQAVKQLIANQHDAASNEGLNSFVSQESQSSVPASLAAFSPPAEAHIPFDQLVFVKPIAKTYYLAKYLCKDVAVKVFVGHLIDPQSWFE
eukprot:Selendium_serpulae@DN5485_c0_g1_i7.p1